MASDHAPTKRTKRLRRHAASEYLMTAWGLSYVPTTLAKLATLGGGPPMEYAGRIPLYPQDGLDVWASAKIGPRVNSTSERAALAA